jgi:hypothetical protein
MGLDMYLNKRKFVGWNYEHMREKCLDELKEIPNLNDFGIDAHKVTYIEEEVFYWRKANAIHRWFVENVQGGKDDCSLQSPVHREHIVELLALINLELAIRDNPEEGNPGDYLPTCPGFFFGSYGYDEWYYSELERTSVFLRDLLNNWDEDADYYYQSSW